MKYLITGGAGFIGSHLVDHLIKDGHEVTVIDDLSTGQLSNINHLKENPAFDIDISSIMDYDSLEKQVKKCDQIYHLAAAVGVKYILENPVETIKTNMKGTENILTLACKYNKKVLMASTSEVYGKLLEENDGISKLREDADWRLGATSTSRWAYACAKAMDEFLSLAYYNQKKLPVVVVRFFNAVGPRQTGSYGMVVPKFIERALADETIEVHGDGEQTRCFTYVTDAVGAIVNLMNTPEAEGEVINIGGEEEVSINQLASKVIEMTGSNSTVTHIPYEEVYGDGFEDMQLRTPDLSKIRRMIAYKPENDIDDIIKKTIQYFRDEKADNKIRA